MCDRRNASNLVNLHSNEMLSNLNDLRENQSLCDITLSVGDCNVPAHKVVLSASSPYFKAMFTQEMAEKHQAVIEFQSIDVEAMKIIVDFAYTGKLEVTSSNVQYLIPAATHLQMTLITEECCRFLESHVHIYNCIGIWRFADTYDLTELTQKLFMFINQNFEEISKFEEIFDLPVKYFMKILKSDDLNVVSEESVFHLMETWVLSDFQARKAHIPKLIELVRLPLLEASFLKRQSQLNRLSCNGYFVQDIYNSLQSANVKDDAMPRCSPKVLCAVGGKRGLFDALGSMEIFIPKDGKWQTASSLPHHRYECGAVVCDRKLYLLGGITCKPYKQHTNSVIVWDPEDDSWSSAPAMLRCRSSFGAVVVRGDIYVLGGYDGVSYLKSMERFSLPKQVWEELPEMSQTRTCFGAAALNDSVYAIGGYGPVHQSSVEVYNIHSRRWTFIAPMLSKRINFGVAVLKKYIYVVGGHSGTNHLRSVERLNLQEGCWETCSPMHRPRTGVGAAAVGGRLYVVGGHSGHEYLNDVDCYDPVKNTWQECAGMDLPRCGFGLAAI